MNRRQVGSGYGRDFLSHTGYSADIEVLPEGALIRPALVSSNTGFRRGTRYGPVTHFTVQRNARDSR
jgi:hypothetical protein